MNCLDQQLPPAVKQQYHPFPPPNGLRKPLKRENMAENSYFWLNCHCPSSKALNGTKGYKSVREGLMLLGRPK
jgi:hypothetical protein